LRLTLASDAGNQRVTPRPKTAAALLALLSWERDGVSRPYQRIWQLFVRYLASVS
jgi:hypothetical protein